MLTVGSKPRQTLQVIISRFQMALTLGAQDAKETVLHFGREPSTLIK